MSLPEHFFISSSDGALCDTRRPNWASHPIRETYQRTFTEIKNSQQLRATLRAGCWAFPGSYEMFLIMSGGESLCFNCARKEYRQLSQAFAPHVRHSDWKVVATGITCDQDEPEVCAQCNKFMSAYYDEEEWAAECSKQEDKGLNLQELHEKYGKDKEHPYFDHEKWRETVSAEETTLGYWEWVVSVLAVKEKVKVEALTFMGEFGMLDTKAKFSVYQGDEILYTSEYLFRCQEYVEHRTAGLTHEQAVDKIHGRGEEK